MRPIPPLHPLQVPSPARRVRSPIRPSGIRYLAALALCTFSVCLLHAQASTSTGDAAGAPAAAATELAPSTAVPVPAPASPAAVPALDSSAAGFGQSQSPAWTQISIAGAPTNRRPPQNPFQLGPVLGSLSGSAGINTGFIGNAGAFGSSSFGSPQPGRVTNSFGTLTMGERTGIAAPSFSLNDAGFAQADLTLPSLNQVLHGSYSPHLNASASSLKFSYRDVYTPGTSFTDVARPPASAMFSTSDLGNGVFLSAGTGFGSHSMAGAPAASIANGTAGPKHSGPSVALKLSF
jgi:hypothetical protein